MLAKSMDNPDCLKDYIPYCGDLYRRQAHGRAR